MSRPDKPKAARPSLTGTRSGPRARAVFERAMTTRRDAPQDARDSSGRGRDDGRTRDGDTNAGSGWSDRARAPQADNRGPRREYRDDDIRRPARDDFRRPDSGPRRDDSGRPRFERDARGEYPRGSRDGDRPRYQGDRPRYDNDRPRQQGERAEGDRPRYQGDRPRYEGDRPRGDAPARREGGFNRDDRPRREGSFNRDERPRGWGGSSRDDGARRDGGYARDDRPARDAGYQREDRPRREGNFARDERPRSGGGFDRGPRPEGNAYSRDDRPRRDAGFARDERPRREGGFNRDDRPRNEGAFARGDAPRRDGAYSRDERPYNRDGAPRREGAYARDVAPRDERRAPQADRPARPAWGDRPPRPAGERGRYPQPPRDLGAAPRTRRHEEDDDEDDDELLPQGVRISKLMAARGICSRREADEYIERGWVLVNGERVKELGRRAEPDAKITLTAEAQRLQGTRATILMHKPVGFVSGQPEDDYPPAMSLVTLGSQHRPDGGPLLKPEHFRGLAPAGRLDIDSTGLLVLTQDGRVARQLIGDDSTVEKEYLVRVEGSLSDEGLALLNHGLELDDKALRPARVEWINEDQLRFVLKEGRKRQIRRMCELVGLRVTGLKRIRIGKVMLGDLPLGQWRFLRDDESFE
ncbi:pseudouridine synthase [Niveibacterium sp. 24ML]|uniref:pseudouridine synthase n=1 Tax=Niveibacterium sp. 24ML TaxID=2985512 RepID=UPI00226EAD04|nr:pseudouridine synthase [Niveibacterium sp. 24ML]MCX9156997.1 pseudouridine synthase [Niveibacterium sp. 24ML]